MKSNPVIGAWMCSLAFSLIVLAQSCVADVQSADLSPLMPLERDYTLMWWANGFPGNIPAAPWRRVIQTGNFAMALDTESLTIPNLGVVRGVEYAAAACADNHAWERLPHADLALTITVDGKNYRCAGGGKWSQFKGPRLIESGRFVQRADVTDLTFAADDGARLNVEARFETVAWPDRLALILAAMPGVKPIERGEACFGRIGGGFGLDGSNHLEIPHCAEIDLPKFTVEFWAFVPTDFQASERTHPWLVCKNQHEQADGNYGIVILDGRPQARMNVGGGRENMFVVDSRDPLKIEQWNHLALSYDGEVMRLFVNGSLAGENKIGRTRKPGSHGLAFGRRQDNCGDGFHFRGVVDEIHFYDRALSAPEIRQRFQRPESAVSGLKPVREWNFRDNGIASMTKPGEIWTNAAMEIRLAGMKNESFQSIHLSTGETWSNDAWREVFVVMDERTGIPSGDGSGWFEMLFKGTKPSMPLVVNASEFPGGAARPVRFDAARGWHCINLDGIEPVIPQGGRERMNDAIERVKLVLENPADREQIARLMFEKTAHGIRQRIGSAITGVSAVLRDRDGNPTGIPVQLSKNWHGRPEAGIYAGQWFHGFSMVRLPPRARIELELAIVYGHWGGVAAASHAQLCLIGWGSNQQWDQSALGAWGESICYEPDQAQAACGILDVRPVMVNSVSENRPWGWTHNVGGGDFFRLFDATGQRIFPSRMRTAFQKQGPCLTEVTYAGKLGDGIEHAETVSLSRSDDIVRGLYRVRLDVKKPVDFSRFVIFQIGADTYSYTGERKMAFGNETGLLKEWATQWGGDTNRTEPMLCAGRVPWISLHEGGEPSQRRSHEATPGIIKPATKTDGAWANRGIVIRSWSARLGGKSAQPWFVEHGVNARGADTSTADIVPPPGVTRLLPGDFVEATFEHVIMPQFATDYYGPDEALRAALTTDRNTWRMIHREAVGNDRGVKTKVGKMKGTYPAIVIAPENNRAEFTLTGGLGYVPVTFSGLPSHRGWQLSCDGIRVDQSVHGRDFWQTDYDVASRRWCLTFNLPVTDAESHIIKFEPEAIAIKEQRDHHK